MLSRMAWNFLIRYWVKKAKVSYGGPGEKGELFNTASFQSAVSHTTGIFPSDLSCRAWLIAFGFHAGHGGCHWFKVK